MVKLGFDRHHRQRYLCRGCGRRCSTNLTRAFRKRKIAMVKKHLGARRHTILTMLDFIQIQLGGRVSDNDLEMLENVVRSIEAARRRSISKKRIALLIKSGEMKMFKCGAYQWIWQPTIIREDMDV